MRTAAVSAVKARLSEYLREVKAGNEVLIVERGKPVARLSPPARTTSAREPLARLEKQGLIRLGTGKLPAGLLKRTLGEDPGDSVLRALLDERRGGR